MKKNLLTASLVLISLALFPFCVRLGPSKASARAEPRNTDYTALVDALDIAAVRSHVEFLTALGTRATGYPGSDMAAQYVYDRFVEYGLENVTYQNFTVVDAFDYGANITILSPDNPDPIRIYPLLPNLVSPSTTPPQGLVGRLIYAGEGYLEDFGTGATEAEADIEGSIVLMDWNTPHRWINAARLGARAVVFIPPPPGIPDTYMHGGYTYEKHLPSVPLNFPRFYVDEAGAAILLSRQGEEARLVSTQRWERLTSRNVLGFVEGKNHDVYVVLSSYYDSYSVAPSNAPGAQEAIGVAALLELARHLAKPENRPQNSLIFAAYGGHGQSIAGSQAFWREYRSWQGTDPAKRAVGDKIWYNINLDLSAGNDAVVLDAEEDLMTRRYIPLAGTWMSTFTYLKGVWEGLNEEKPHGKTYRPPYYGEFYGAGDVMLPRSLETQANWEAVHPPWNDIPADHGFALMVNTHAFTIRTATDPRPFYWTPFDTLDKVDFGNLETLLELASVLTIRFVNVGDVPALAGPTVLEHEKGTTRYTIEAGSNWVITYGQVGRWSKETGFYEPVPNALVVWTLYTQNPELGYSHYNRRGPRTHPYREVQFADEQGNFELWSWMVDGYVSAWVINETTGSLIMAPDLGEHIWAEPLLSSNREQEHDLGFLAVFNCSTMALFDVMVPGRKPIAPAEGTLPAPIPPVQGVYLSFLYGFPEFISPTSRGSWTWGIAPHVTVMAFPPDTAVAQGWGLAGTRYSLGFLLNVSAEFPMGRGYEVRPGEQLVVPVTALRYAENFYWLNEERFNVMAEVDPEVLESQHYLDHLEAGALIEEAREAFENREYARAYDRAFRAWSLGIEVYNQLRPGIEDAVLTVPFISAFFVPFVFLSDKLLFGWKGLKRVASFLVLFASSVAAFWLLHPGFSLASAPIMIIIGFSVLILCLPVLVIVCRYVWDLTRELRQRRLGVHEVAVRRVSEVDHAFLTGVENMRRMKLRTTLTLLSVALMVAALVSVTSISPLEVFRATPVLGAFSNYQGVYIHLRLWGEGSYAIQDDALNLLKAAYEEEATIVPRAWRYTRYRSLVDPVFRTAFLTTYKGETIRTPVLWGLTSEEKGLEAGLFLEAGRWFIPGERGVVILNREQADRLGVNVTHVAMGIAPTVIFETMPHRVVGIIGTPLEYLSTLDGEEITPIKFDYPEVPNPWNVHVTMDYCLILPYEEVIELGGQTASVSIVFDDPTRVREAANEIRRLFPSLNTFSCVGEEVLLHTGGVAFSVWGLQQQMVPMAIVVLSVLNILLGSVYERRRDIGTYGVIGLSPIHISFMFLAEALVYALLGGVIGFVLSMTLGKLMGAVLPGVLVLNYSSKWVFIAIGFAMVTTVLSSLYPMRVASKLVTPSLERVWRIPTKPRRDLWEIPLPFYTRDDQEAGGIIAFIREYMGAHTTRDAADFFATDLSLAAGEAEGNPYRSIKAETRLFPYDIGVAQTSTFYVVQVEPRRWQCRVVLNRTAGPRDQWVTLNYHYVDILRKQLLLWRSVSHREREKYIKAFKEAEGG